MKRGHQQLDEEEKKNRITIVKGEPLQHVQQRRQQQQPSQPDKGKGLAVKRSRLTDDNKDDRNRNNSNNDHKFIDMVLKLSVGLRDAKLVH